MRCPLTSLLHSPPPQPPHPSPCSASPQAPLLVYVGRLGAEKNLDFLLPLLQALPGVRLALVGGGPEEPRLRTQLAGLPVTFAGMLSGDALSAAYASADIFVMPSESETLGFVVLEVGSFVSPL